MKTQSQLINRERNLRLIAVFSLFAIFFVVLGAIDNMLFSFILSFASAYFLAPFVRYLTQRGLQKDLAILIPFTALFAAITLAIVLSLPLVITQIQDLQLNLPKYLNEISILIEKWETSVNKSIPFKINMDVTSKLGTWSELTLSNGLQYAPKLASQLFTVLLLSPLFTYFILKDGQSISRAALSVFPNHFYELAFALSNRINKQLGEFIRARLIEALIVGAIVFIGLTVLSYPYALFLSVFAVIMNLIPYVGPFIGVVPAFLIGLINHEPSFTVLLVSLIYLFAQIIDILFVIPFIVARTVNLHPISVIVVFIIGAQLMGVMGMVISVPIASAAKLIFLTVYDQLIKFRA